VHKILGPDIKWY